MRQLLFSTILMVSVASSASAATVENQGHDAQAAIKLAVAGANATVAQFTRASVQQPSHVRRSSIVVEFGFEGTRPASFDRVSVERHALAYCRSVSYPYGRAIQVSKVPGLSGQFTYYQVDRLICFD
jgi:hypothetical protein